MNIADKMFFSSVLYTTVILGQPKYKPLLIFKKKSLKSILSKISFS